MKKNDAVQLTIIILALVLGFSAVGYFLSFFANLIYLAGSGEFISGLSAPVFIGLLITFVQSVICWLLITKSGAIAAFIYEKTNIGNTFKIIINPADLLYLLLIVSGFVLLMQGLPPFLKAVVNGFSSKASSRFSIKEYEEHADWTLLFLQLLLPAVLLMAARPIANYFAVKAGEAPLEISQEPGDGDDNDLIDN